ncbi:MAG: PilZ domain-containing protein [Gemmataceae bacterium]|nr:PilZ domain-containing protein [Gemmataceae bacterium]
MIMTDLQGVANTVVRRAQRQGFVLPREVREEVTHAGVEETLWKDVLALARPSLSYRQGRYYYVHAVSDRLLREQRLQRGVQRAVRQLIRQHKKSITKKERRGQDRVDFIQPVKVITEDQREFTLLSRDISITGIRLIGTRSLLGQRVRVLLTDAEQEEPWCFLVRILWTCAVGDELFENGGAFLEMIDQQPEELPSAN